MHLRQPHRDGIPDLFSSESEIQQGHHVDGRGRPRHQLVLRGYRAR